MVQFYHKHFSADLSCINCSFKPDFVTQDWKIIKLWVPQDPETLDYKYSNCLSRVPNLSCANLHVLLSGWKLINWRSRTKCISGDQCGETPIRSTIKSNISGKLRFWVVNYQEKQASYRQILVPWHTPAGQQNMQIGQWWHKIKSKCDFVL